MFHICDSIHTHHHSASLRRALRTKLVQETADTTSGSAFGLVKFRLVSANSPMSTPLIDTIGMDHLREVITDFYARLTRDVMIGFLFHGKDETRLIEKEVEFTARLLGADIPYTGRPIRQAHANSPILGGHFSRRLQILKETLADHQVDIQVQQTWLEHTLALRSQVTTDAGDECTHTASHNALANSNSSDDS